LVHPRNHPGRKIRRQPEEIGCVDKGPRCPRTGRTPADCGRPTRCRRSSETTCRQHTDDCYPFHRSLLEIGVNEASS
jgi:hypothetical protein